MEFSSQAAQKRSGRINELLERALNAGLGRDWQRVENLLHLLDGCLLGADMGAPIARALPVLGPGFFSAFGLPSDDHFVRASLVLSAVHSTTEEFGEILSNVLSDFRDMWEQHPEAARHLGLAICCFHTTMGAVVQGALEDWTQIG